MAKKKQKEQKQNRKNIIQFPAQVLQPIQNFLLREKQRLEAQKRGVSKSDPFSDPDRVIDNAANDAEAQEQFGHEQASALKRQLDTRLVQIRKALTSLKLGRYGNCEKCQQMINTERLTLMPDTTLCAKCAQEKES